MMIMLLSVVQITNELNLFLGLGRILLQILHKSFNCCYTNARLCRNGPRSPEKLHQQSKQSGSIPKLRPEYHQAEEHILFPPGNTSPLENLPVVRTCRGVERKTWCPPAQEVSRSLLTYSFWKDDFQRRCMVRVHCQQSEFDSRI